MRISVKVTPEVSKFVESSSQFEKKSACDILVEKLRTEYEDEQRAIKELDDFLKPAVIAAKNGDVVNQTFDEIVEGVRKEVVKESE